MILLKIKNLNRFANPCRLLTLESLAQRSQCGWIQLPLPWNFRANDGGQLKEVISEVC